MPELQPVSKTESAKEDFADTYICHCEDVTLERLLEMMGNRTSITAQELKHITRIGMGVCRGSRCLQRARQALRNHGIEVIGEFTPRGPMAKLVEIGASQTAKVVVFSSLQIATPVRNLSR